jgi:hypothetical protein
LRTSFKVAVAVASMVAVVAGARDAAAAPMDPTPDRLALQPPDLGAGGMSCQQIAAAPGTFLKNNPSWLSGANHNGSLPACLPNNGAWANMMGELGYAIAPSAFHPARTTGFGGFALSLEASYAHINADAQVSATDPTQYWHQGTQGAVDPNTHQFSTRNNAPDSILQIYSVKATKGLPFGFQVTGALGYVANTSLWVGGADLHWALLEGFRTGILGYLPDIAVGGGVRTLAGSPDFYLTTVGIDAELSKPIALADSAVLTPYVGVQRLYIFADSSVVNLAPNTDPLQVCGYQGNDPSSGQPRCANGPGSNAAFNDLSTFDKVRLQNWRGIVGLTYRYEILAMGAEFAMDMEDPGTEGTVGDRPANTTVSGEKQWTTSLELGVFF